MRSPLSSAQRSARRQLVLTARARALLASPTQSEQTLWLALRELPGVSFKRQVVVLGFVADFLAPRARLIVEVDGGSHAGRRAADARRDRKLARTGYRVVRLEAELVMRNLPAALERVRAALNRG